MHFRFCLNYKLCGQHDRVAVIGIFDPLLPYGANNTHLKSSYFFNELLQCFKAFEIILTLNHLMI